MYLKKVELWFTIILQNLNTFKECLGVTTDWNMALITAFFPFRERYWKQQSDFANWVSVGGGSITEQKALVRS